MKSLLFLLLSFLPFSVIAQEVEFTPKALAGPALQGITDITGSGDGSGRLFVVEKRGAIRIVRNDTVLSQEFLSITNLVINNGERGLLGLAFHPQYPDSPYIYVNYVMANSIITRIARFTVPAGSPNNADESSIRVIMDVPGIETNHKAGDLVFGPDGFLYLTMGDGGGGGDPEDTGQDFTRRLGKILRIDVNTISPPNNYSIPPDNPYLPYTGAGDTLPEIWMNGVRNPWRISFDRVTGDLWIADVGQNLYEEINMIPAGTGAGRNLGWDCREGFHNYSPSHCDTVAMPLTYPIMEYPHSCPPCPYGNGFSVTGGFVYRGSMYPDMIGKYVAVDFSTNDVFIIEQTSPNTFTITGHNGTGNSGVTTFGEDDNGELYAGNLGGILYQVSMGEPLAISWENFGAFPLPKGAGNKVQWTLHNISEVDHFEIERASQADFLNFVKIAEIPADHTKISYAYTDLINNTQEVYYRVLADMLDGSREYSPVAKIIPIQGNYPSLVYDFNTNMWRIHLPEFWQNGDLKLYDLQGRVVYSSKLVKTPNVDFTSPITPGIYFISITGDEGSWSERIVR